MNYVFQIIILYVKSNVSYQYNGNLHGHVFWEYNKLGQSFYIIWFTDFFA